MIHCVCESCNTPVEVSDNYAGTRIACKSCKAILHVPAATNGASAPKPPAAAAPPQAPAKAPAPQKPAAPQAPAKAPQPQAKAPAPAPQPQAKAAPPKPAAPPQPAAKPPAAQKPPAAAPQPQAKAPQPQAKAPAPAPQPAAKPQPPKPPEPTATLVMVEAVQFNCTQCGNILQAWPEQVGMAMNCPYCQAALTVPTPVPAAPPPQILARPAPVKSAGSHPNVPVKSAGSQPNVPVKSAGSHPKPPQPPAKGAAPKKAIRFPCDKCKATIQADPSQAGLMIVCPQCRHDMTVPEPS